MWEYGVLPPVVLVKKATALALHSSGFVRSKEITARIGTSKARPGTLISVRRHGWLHSRVRTQDPGLGTIKIPPVRVHRIMDAFTSNYQTNFSSITARLSFKKLLAVLGSQKMPSAP